MNKENKKIEIVYIIPNLAQGGAERFISDLLLNLDLNIFSATLILFQGGGEWLTELEKHKISVKIFRKRFKIDFYNFWQIFHTLQKIQPQIVHTQLGGDIYGVLAAKLLKIAIIINTEQNINKSENYLTTLIKKITKHWTTKIIAISQAVKDDLIQRYQVSEQKVIIIPNGLEINKFLNSSQKLFKNLSLNNSPIIFGTIGRLSAQKGQKNLILAWSKLKNKRIKCLIVGQGPLKNQLQKQIKDLGLEKRVELLGALTNIPNFLKSLDAFVLPSLWEGQGIVLLEAGLSNLPIIASGTGGISELINSETGYLVPVNNSQALAMKIDWLADNLQQEIVLEKVKNLQNEIINNYDIKRITKNYENLYQELLTIKKVL